MKTIRLTAALAFSAMMAPTPQGHGGSTEPKAPKLLFEKTALDIGIIKEGDQVQRRFPFRNGGSADLVIREVRSSCGCTAATASTGPFRPGEAGGVEVSYDSRGKIGRVEKEVTVLSNDPASPQTLVLTGVSLGVSHMQRPAGAFLFAGSCAQCHALPAKGRMGKELYDSVCFLCHDFPAESGKSAVAPGRRALSGIKKRRLRRLIAAGVPQSSMPGFDKAHGGPLSKQQINSLADYIRSLREK